MVDTPGFSSFEITDIEPGDLRNIIRNLTSLSVNVDLPGAIISASRDAKSSLLLKMD